MEEHDAMRVNRSETYGSWLHAQKMAAENKRLRESISSAAAAMDEGRDNDAYDILMHELYDPA